MTRPLAGFATAAAFACTIGLHANAQTTKVDVDHGKKVTYTGCVQSGTETDSYVLANAIPMTESETRGTTGTMTENSYLLIPEKTITLHEHIGQRVQVTGVVIKPGHGNAKIETETRENGKTAKSKEEVKRGPLPQFEVVSIKPLGEPCR
jgi:hypothetical protein